jgi:hypothetical protein
MSLIEKILKTDSVFQLKERRLMTLFNVIEVLFSMAALFFILIKNFIVVALIILLFLIFSKLKQKIVFSKKTLFKIFFHLLSERLFEIIVLTGFVFFYPVAAITALSFSLLSNYTNFAIFASKNRFPSNFFGANKHRLLILSIALFLHYFSPTIFNISLIELTLYLIALIALTNFYQKIMFLTKK